MLLSTSRRYAQRSLRNRLLHAAAVCLCVFAPAVVVIGELGGSASASLSAKIDTDADGIPNQVDNDIDGDGILNSVDTDVDGDGIANGVDLDVDGDTLLNGDKKELDVDSDGIADNLDPDIDGDGLMNGADADVDGDGVPNAVDPDVDGDAIKNAKDPDIDGDGLVNGIDPDIDGDGILNGVDTDTDGDGKANDAKSEKDTDGDGILNATDSDIDGDGILNAVDPDVDGDGINNAIDPDIDGDGRLNGASSEKDIDGDGLPDAVDPDVDGDGIANATDPDIDGDGVLNATDNDQDGDGVSNKRDSDSNGDGTDDGAVAGDHSNPHQSDDDHTPVPPQAGGGTTTFTSTLTFAVPPASHYAGVSGGDGWDLALTTTDVYNVFHHAGSLVIACHHQIDATPCWTTAAKTITDTTTGANFATASAPGIHLTSAGFILLYATRTSDATAGVVCIDTNLPAANPNPYCGFTPLSGVGEAFYNGLGHLSNQAVVTSRIYAVNQVDFSGDTASRNRLLCYDTVTQAPCVGQPYSLGLGARSATPGVPGTQIANIGGRLIIELSTSLGDSLVCIDGATGASCAGTWPAAVPTARVGTPFPLLDALGTVTGVCIPAPSVPCFLLDGTPAASTPAMQATISPSEGYSGPSVTSGTRVYIPNMRSTKLECFDYRTGAGCPLYPKTPGGMALLYTVNLDPQRPDCLWVTGDSGLNIQNFDAFTGGNCGDGPIKILAQGFVDATVPPCPPLSYTSLQVVSPAPGTYTSATVSFLDLNNLPLAGAPDAPLDPTGTVSLAGLSLNSAGGLPKFVITLVGAPTRPGAVSATLKWIGPTDPSCVVGGSPPTHLDEDHDGIENAHDPDIDGDGLRNGSDSDIDGDKVTNSKDSDKDGDGIPNSHDADANGDGVNDRTGAPTNSGSASPKPAKTNHTNTNLVRPRPAKPPKK